MATWALVCLALEIVADRTSSVVRIPWNILNTPDVRNIKASSRSQSTSLEAALIGYIL